MRAYSYKPKCKTLHDEPRELGFLKEKYNILIILKWLFEKLKEN
jgi:hypothetical protein